MPISWLNSSAVDTNSLILLLLSPYSFRSSINKTWLFFSPPLKVYLALALCSTKSVVSCMSQIRKVINYHPEKVVSCCRLSPNVFANLSLIFIQIRGCCQTLAQVQGFPISRNGEPYNPSHNQFIPSPDLYVSSCC